MRYIASQLVLRRKEGLVSVDTLPKLLRREGLFESPQEAFYVAAYDTRANIASVFEVARGDHKEVTVNLPLLTGGVLAAGVTRFWVIHNHPSGYLEPTQDDKELTQRIMMAAAVQGLTMEDHIIIGPPDGWLSMAKSGLVTIDEAISNVIAAARAGEEMVHR